MVTGLTACDDGSEDGNGVADSNFTVNGNTATVRWDKYDGANGYSIEKAPSKYGDYEYLDYVNSASATEYVTNDINSYYRITAFTDSGESVVIGTYSLETELFGENTCVYAPTDDPAKIQEELDAFYNKTDGTKEGAQGRARGEFTEERFAALFKPGDYNLNINIGYYTALSGLGLSPDDVTVSKISADAPISLCNFWRTVENLTVNGNMLWSVSQATSLRRVHVKGDMKLSGSGSTSGGFLADTKVDGTVNSGSQQQWFSRNASFGNWSGCVWNTAFVGVDGNRIPQNVWSGTSNNYTNIENSGAVREKPFLTYDSVLGYRVFVPDADDNTRGVSWSETKGEYLSLDKFYVARSDRDTAATINAALAEGKNLILTAGVYELDAPIKIENANTVVLGLGLATLRPTDDNADTLMRIADTDNICIGGVLFDAGKRTETLLEVGEKDCNKDHSSKPSVLADLFSA